MAAAMVRHGPLRTQRLLAQQVLSAAGYATKAEKKKGIDRKVPPRIEWTANCLASKGFLRPQKEYSPPSDLKRKLDEVLQAKVGSLDNDASLGGTDKKFEVLTACAELLQHSVPNSQLHAIENVGDVREFYLTPVCTKTPLDKLKNIELPPNLYVRHEYHRFHPDTDTMFGGVTAFPKSSTLVTGIKYKEKYKGHTQATTWPYN